MGSLTNMQKQVFLLNIGICFRNFTPTRLSKGGTSKEDAMKTNRIVVVFLLALLCVVLYGCGAKTKIESAITPTEIDKAIGNYHLSVKVMNAEKLKIFRKKDRKVFGNDSVSIIGSFEAEVIFQQDVAQVGIKSGTIHKCFVPFYAVVVEEKGEYVVKTFRIYGVFPYDMPDFDKQKEEFMRDVGDIKM